jgi:Fe-S cluster assembly protein SufD
MTPGWLTDIRSKAKARFDEVGYPTAKLEDWRFTNVSPISKQNFHASKNGLVLGEAFRAAFFSRGARLAFVNGKFAPALSSLAGLPAGLVVGNLAALYNDPKEGPQIEKHLAKHAQFNDPAQSFVALNTSHLEDGAYVRIPAGTVLADPVTICFIATEDGVSAHPRVLVIAEAHSQGAIVEQYIGDSATFTNTVTEIVAGENAIVEHYKLQQESAKAFHVGTFQVNQARSSNVTDHSVTLGGKISRNDLNFVLDGAGAEAVLNGLYIGAGDQHIANHSRIDHASPHCPSRELYKGILDDRSSAVFNGGIVVRQIAQKTDAKQSNKNLLLSDDATINTKPQLEIWADDVKCTHGATIGHLDDEMLFYLRSRGIGEPSARSILTFAFANELLGRMKVPEVRARLEKAVLAKLEGK